MAESYFEEAVISLQAFDKLAEDGWQDAPIAQRLLAHATANALVGILELLTPQTPSPSLPATDQQGAPPPPPERPAQTSDDATDLRTPSEPKTTPATVGDAVESPARASRKKRPGASDRRVVTPAEKVQPPATQT